MYDRTADDASRTFAPPARAAALSAMVGALVLALVLALLAGHSTGGGEPGEGERGDDHRAVPDLTDREWTVDTPTGEAALLHNPLYSTGRLAPLPCPAPPLDVRSSESMADFLNTIADCLDQAWAIQFAKAGLPFEPPGRVFWTEPGVSPCREYPSAAGGFYCRSSKSVYIGVEDVVEKWKHSTDSVVYASLLAHEYGHHVQGESGLLEYYHERRRREPEAARQSAWTRKGELQANCLAGVFLGSVGVTYPIGAAEREVIRADAAATADRPGSGEAERTHGSAENSVLWVEIGMEHQSPGDCNTWNAADDLLQ